MQGIGCGSNVMRPPRYYDFNGKVNEL